MRLSIPDSVIWNDIARCYILMCDEKQCIRALRNALELDSDYDEAVHNLSLMLVDVDIDEAEFLA